MLPFPVYPSDISYSQVYSPPVLVEQTHAPGMSSLLNTLLLIIPLSLALGIIWSKKHRMYLHVIEQQRAMLERIWQLSSTK